MIKSISTGKPELQSIPMNAKTKKLVKDAARMFYELKHRSDKITCLPHFKLQVDFFSQEAESAFFKAIGKCIIAEGKARRSKAKP